MIYRHRSMFPFQRLRDPHIWIVICMDNHELLKELCTNIIFSNENQVYCIIFVHMYVHLYNSYAYTSTGYIVQIIIITTIIPVFKESISDVERKSFLVEARRHDWVVYICLILTFACCMWCLLFNNKAMDSLPSLLILPTSWTKSVVVDGIPNKITAWQFAISLPITRAKFAMGCFIHCHHHAASF